MVDREAGAAAATIEEFAKANGQILLPLVELVTQARVAVDEVVARPGVVLLGGNSPERKTLGTFPESE